MSLDVDLADATPAAATGWFCALSPSPTPARRRAPLRTPSCTLPSAADETDPDFAIVIPGAGSPGRGAARP